MKEIQSKERKKPKIKIMKSEVNKQRERMKKIIAKEDKR